MPFSDCLRILTKTKLSNNTESIRALPDHAHAPFWHFSPASQDPTMTIPPPLHNTYKPFLADTNFQATLTSFKIYTTRAVYQSALINASLCCDNSANLTRTLLKPRPRVHVKSERHSCWHHDSVGEFKNWVSLVFKWNSRTKRNAHKTRYVPYFLSSRYVSYFLFGNNIRSFSFIPGQETHRTNIHCLSHKSHISSYVYQYFKKKKLRFSDSQ